MMNSIDGWMGGGMWIWSVVGVLVLVLLGVVMSKLSDRESGVEEPPVK